MTDPIDVAAMLGSDRGRVGFVGIGRMGAAMLDAVLAAGFPVCVYDVRAKAVQPYLVGEHDLVSAATPRELATRCAVIDIVVNTDQHLLDACLGVDGLIAGARAGTVVLVHSTIALDTLRKVAAAGDERGVHVLDAAISGRWGHMSVGDLCVMVGGDAAAFAAARPVLDTYGGLVLHLGPLGSGLDTKLALNVIRYHTFLAAKEASSLLAAAGVTAPLSDIVAHTGASVSPMAPPAEVGAGLAEFRDAERLRNNAATARKDLRAAVARAAELGIELPSAAKTVETIHTFWGIEPPADFRVD